KPHELKTLRCRDHAKRLTTAAWELGDRSELDSKRLRRWAHQFGFGGHCFTKSLRFSTTFKALREGRALYAAAHSGHGGEAEAKSDHNLVPLKDWDYAGRGYPRPGDGLLALSSRARARERRRLAREAAMDERAGQTTDNGRRHDGNG
ncbi:MAG: hypothetical protein FWD04_13060, partial [Conexibacteraceae bacterium]|nr:hypothetical protein [Conexibacteraceae bacterium]